MVLHRSGRLLLSSSSGPVLSGCALRRSLAVRRAVISLHPVSSRSAVHFGSDRSSRHCRITAGLASMDVPLLVSLLSLSSGGAVRGSTAPVGWWGVSPYFACCPTSSVPKRSSFGISASGFRFKSSRWGHPSGSGLSQSSIGSKALAPPSWCVLRVFAMGSPCRVVICSRSRSKRRFVGAPSLVVGVLPSRAKASSIHLSLVASRWGHPAGRVCGFPHSIVTKLSLVSCLVFLQDEVTLTGLDL